jgi:hypothetical protein
MKIRDLYDNTYTRLAVLTPTLFYAGTQLADYQPPETGIRECICDFQTQYKLSDAQLASLGLIGVTGLWAGVGLYKEGKKYKTLEDKLEEKEDVEAEREEIIRNMPYTD